MSDSIAYIGTEKHPSVLTRPRGNGKDIRGQRSWMRSDSQEFMLYFILVNVANV